MTTAGVGKSFKRQSRSAGRDATSAALSSLASEDADLLLVFATAAHDQGELLAGIAEFSGDAKVSGCSGEGIITMHESAERDFAVAVMAIASSGMRFETFLLDGYASDPVGCAAELARLVEAAGTDDAVSLLVFPDGILGDCSRFLSALDAALTMPLLTMGGTSADGMKFERTFQYQDEKALSGAVSAVLITGQGRLEYAVSHGCVPFGLEREVTKSADGWVHEIDGMAAWSVFKEYLDGDPVDLNAEGILHLCLGEPVEANDYSPYIIRTPMELDAASGALFFPGGGLEVGTKIRMVRRDPAQIRASARACADKLRVNLCEENRDLDESLALVLQFDCAGRGQALFGSCATEEIVRPLQDALGDSVPWIGFHTYGEIAPLCGDARYHNYTVALCAIYDSRCGRDADDAAVEPEREGQNANALG